MDQSQNGANRERVFTSSEVAKKMHEAELNQIDRYLRDESVLHREAEMNRETERGLVAANSALGRTVAELQNSVKARCISIDTLRFSLERAQRKISELQAQLEANAKVMERDRETIKLGWDALKKERDEKLVVIADRDNLKADQEQCDRVTFEICVERDCLRSERDALKRRLERYIRQRRKPAKKGRR